MPFQCQKILHRLSADGAFLCFALHDLSTSIAKAHVVAWLNDCIDRALGEANEASLVVAGLRFQNALSNAIDVHKVAPGSVQHNIWSRQATFAYHSRCQSFRIDLEEIDDLLESASKFGAALDDQDNGDHIVKGPGQLFESVVAEV